MKEQTDRNLAEISTTQKQEFRDWWKKNKNKVHAPKKYYKAQKSAIIEDTKKLFSQNPSMPIKKVILEIMTPLPDFLPADNLVKVVGYIIKTWEKEISKNVS